MRFVIKNILPVIALGLLIFLFGCQKPPVEEPPPPQNIPSPARVTSLTTQQEKNSYSIGVDIGKGIKRQGVDVNIEIIAQGIRDELTGESLLMSNEEMQASLQAIQNEIMQKQAQAAMQKGEENKKQGDAFLAENKTKEGVITTDSGLQYKIIKQGTGKKPRLNDTVECHYQGTLIDGTEFDSSYRRGEPATFPVNGVIPGWTEALQMMPVGSKWQLYIPSELAYGPQGRPPVIGSNQTLIFVIELLAIK